MTKNSIKKMKKPSPPKGLKGVKKATRRYGGAQMMGAPAGVSQDLQQFTEFYPHPAGRTGIQIHSCAAIYNVRKIAAGSVGGALSGITAGESISIQLNLTDPAGLANAGTKSAHGFLTPIFDLIGSAFVRYKVKKLVFHYEPQASATDSQRLVFAFANDPLHPVLWNATVPGQDDLLSLSDSIAFMPWRAWSMDVTESLTKESLYTYSSSSTTVAEFVERFSDFGVISCITSANTGTSTFGGVLYMETIVELDEFCPISVTRPALLGKLLKKVERHYNSRAQRGKDALPAPEEQSSTTEVEGNRTQRLLDELAKIRSVADVKS